MKELDELVKVREEIIARAQLKRLAKRNNYAGLGFLGFHCLLIAATGWLVYLSLGSWWIVPAEHEYAPVDQHPLLVREARLMVAVYAAVAALALYFGSWTPVIYWLLPRFVGESYARWIRVAEHTGCEEGSDPRANTRTTLTNPFIRTIWWNMPYHAEHHLCAFVPFHALSKLHEQVHTRLSVSNGGYFKVHLALIRRFVRLRHGPQAN